MSPWTPSLLLDYGGGQGQAGAGGGGGAQGTGLSSARVGLNLLFCLLFVQPVVILVFLTAGRESGPPGQVRIRYRYRYNQLQDQVLLATGSGTNSYRIRYNQLQDQVQTAT